MRARLALHRAAWSGWITRTAGACMDWLKETATEQGRAIMAGLVSPLDLVEGYLDAITREKLSPRIYARTTEDRARAEAVAAHDRARAQLRRGLLDGVSLSWKDNIDSAGVATEAGSLLLEGRVPAADAAALATATAQVERIAELRLKEMLP